jgi:uncharacterized SAM-binding protein YcdF (DUF218 family)
VDGRSPRIRKVLVPTLVATALLAVAGIPVYVVPQVDPLRPADAILILGGYSYERYPYGLELALQGLAPQVVVSNTAGEEDIWLTDLCTHQRYRFTVSCFRPDPPTTTGEARELRRLSAEQGWRRVIVVTFRPHISRARYITESCFNGELIMTESPADISVGYWVWAYVYQTAGYLRAVLQPAC